MNIIAYFSHIKNTKMWTIIIVVIIILMLASAGNERTKSNEKMKAEGFNLDDKIDTGKLIAGHPQIDKSIDLTAIFPKDKWLFIYEYPEGKAHNSPRHRAGIDIQSIKNIIIEDASSIEKRITVGRLLAVGIFAFAWKKKQKNELSYLTIEWNDGKMSHETYFEFEGKDSMQRANTARNKLLHFLP